MIRNSIVVIYLVTHRRSEMFRRALDSVLAQTHANLRVRVVNDDPADSAVERIIAEAKDGRASLYQPARRRGPTQNFNLMLQEEDADFVSMLEDDNWWEPTFLEEMLAALHAHPAHQIIVGNERRVKELAGGGWLDTGQTIWPFSDVRVHRYRIEDICGSTRICNSSMVIRAVQRRDFATPDSIKVDVTEHFRERLLPSGKLLMHGAALVNYAETLQTARSTKGEEWGVYQTLLIGSAFVAATSKSSRRCLAARLWRECGSLTSPRAVTLIQTGLLVREARSLLTLAPAASLGRFALWIAAGPLRLMKMRRKVNSQTHQSELNFLAAAPLTRRLAGALPESPTAA
ncbi:MAG: glycosyltransferase [Beijerinckiaceae bacterium]|jgi:hypothetical protein|nr:glycosyltransferase [Beijerinckiaceae bacterium]MDO9442944.1 glycosyltransferase family 2 protein [Beijerinckiaceae bacterium]